MTLTKIISETAKLIFQFLEKNGKASGGTVKDRCNLSDGKYRLAKEELKKHNLVVLGKGRGGTIELIEGVTFPVEKKLTQKEITELARRAKKAKAEERRYNARQKRERDKRIKSATKKAKKEYPDFDCIFHAINIKDDIIYVEVWHDIKNAWVLPY